MRLWILQNHFFQILSFKPFRVFQNGFNDLITFISEVHKLHPPYTCTAPPEYVIVAKEVEIDGWYNGEVEVPGG
jgi:hypothetical protein